MREPDPAVPELPRPFDDDVDAAADARAAALRLMLAEIDAALRRNLELARELDASTAALTQQAHELVHGLLAGGTAARDATFGG